MTCDVSNPLSQRELKTAGITTFVNDRRERPIQRQTFWMFHKVPNGQYPCDHVLPRVEGATEAWRKESMSGALGSQVVIPSGSPPLGANINGSGCAAQPGRCLCGARDARYCPFWEFTELRHTCMPRYQF